MEWISTKEKLPPYNRNVLVCRPNKFSGNIDILIGVLYEKTPVGQRYGKMGGIAITYNDYWALPSVQLLDHITHWMPLPNPPEGL